MTTAPFASDIEDAHRTSRHVLRATATHPDFDAPVSLEVTSRRISLSERRAPRVEADLTCKLPDADVLDLLDPRLGVRVEIELGYVRPGGTVDVHKLFDLGLRDRRVDRRAKTMTLSLASDEALLVDAAPAVSVSVSEASHADAINTLIRQAIVPYPAFSNSVSGGSVTVDPVDDRWSAAQDLADRLGAQLYDNGLREWILAPASTDSGTSVLTLTGGESGTLTGAQDTLSRSEWYNYVTLRYEWRDAADVDQVVQATALVAAGPYSATGASGKRILLDERRVQTTQAEANTAASSVLYRAHSRARSYGLRAISAYWLRPGDTVTVQLPGEDPALHLVSEVTFGDGDEMDLSTRLPADADLNVAYMTTTTPDGAPVEDDPAPPAATTYVSSWEATDSATYKGAGAKRTDLSGEIGQGYFSSFNGNQRALMLFGGANSVGSETGVTITSALSGATVSKVEVWVSCSHTYSYAGTDLLFGYHPVTAIPATFSGGSPYVTARDVERGEGRWVNITSSAIVSALKAGTCRAVSMGPGPSASQFYYAMVYNHAASSTLRPKLRLTYSK